MTRLLQINSSLHGDAGQSSRLADAYVRARAAVDPALEVVRRDLAREPVPHLDAARFGAFVTAAAERTPAQQALVAESDALIAELRAADVLVLAVPMYNFGVPSQLKSWFDHLARAGVTFRYTEHGPEGLLTGKRAIVFAARGGLQAGTGLDAHAAYVRDFLAFLGITAVEFVHADGLSMGEAPRERALAAAADATDRLLRRVPALAPAAA